MTEEQRKLFIRIKQTQDGLDFIEYLKELGRENYNVFLECDPKFNDYVKGIGVAYNSLIKDFENCADKVIQNKETEINAFI